MLRSLRRAIAPAALRLERLGAQALGQVVAFGPLASAVARVRRLSLLGRFTLIGLTASTLIASGLAWAIEARLSSLMQEQLTARAIEQAEFAVLDGLTAADFVPPHPPERLARLAERLDPTVTRLRHEGLVIIRLHIFDRNGTVIYSDLPSKRGQRVAPETSPLLARALAGEVGTKLSTLSSAENADLKARYGEALEVYVPVRVEGEIVGAYEIYQDLAPVRSVRQFVWAATVGALALVLLALYPIVRWTARLISDQQRVLQQQALFDPLTQLPNRALLIHLLRAALHERSAAAPPVALLYLDLDNFKMVNDSLGHDAGDRLLGAVADRLRDCVASAGTVARIGGDEFAILLDGVPDPGRAIALAERVRERLRAPFHLDGQDLFVHATIGIALSAPEQRLAEELLRHADVALNEAIRNGRGGYAVYAPEMNARVRRRLELETALHRALLRGEFRLYFQPIVELGSAQVVEVEALVRWEDPDRSLVSPAEFIPLAEETGLIVPLGRWVLEEACRQARAWQPVDPTGRPVVVSVNLSARQLQHPGLVEEVRRTLARTGLPASSLKLEITESLLLEDQNATAGTLQALRDSGIQLAIDDFGTGYSALGYLKRFPIDALKIDRSFIRGLGQNPRDTAIVRAMIAFAQALGLSVTAEGIETTEQLRHLRALGCDRGQGYYFARPLPSDEVGALLATIARPRARARQVA